MMFTSDYPLNPQQDLSSLVPPPTQQNGWNQNTPEYMPWGCFPQPRVTRFSAEQQIECQSQPPNLQVSLWNPEDNWDGPSSSSFKPSKRKLEDDIEGQVRKQLITEEKITAHLSQLRISPTQSTTEEPIAEMMEGDEISLSPEGIKVKPDSKLVLSEEIRRLRHESNIPQYLLDSFAKPTMAVVLWQPRNALHQLVEEARQAEEESRRNERPEEIAVEDVELPEDDSNNNEPIGNFNMESHLPDLAMDEDL